MRASSMPAMAPAPMPPPVDTAGGTKPSCFTVPVEALAADSGDGSQPTPPATGDKVSIQVDGIVSGVTGGQAEVTMTAVNGQPLADDSEPDEGDMRGMAQQADDEAAAQNS